MSQALFFTDQGARRLYKDHVRAVSSACPPAGPSVRGKGWHRARSRAGVHMQAGSGARCRQPSASGALRAAPQRAAAPLTAALAAARRLSCFLFALLQVLERRNSVTGRQYRSDPTILAYDLLNEPRCSAYEVRRRMRGEREAGRGPEGLRGISGALGLLLLGDAAGRSEGPGAPRLKERALRCAALPFPQPAVLQLRPRGWPHC